MSLADPVGLRGLHSITWYVRELERKRRLFVDTLGFREVSAAGACWASDRGAESLVFEAGECRVVCTTPTDESSAAARFLRHHPEGIGGVTFEVESLARARGTLSERDATFISNARGIHAVHGSHGGNDAWLELATPIDDLQFCFVERARTRSGVAPKVGAPRPGPSHFDHITINTGTILPVALWLRHLLGLETYWQTEFHTSDDDAPQTGSGLKSVVLWDPTSGIKFALNEPKPPNFFASQIELFRQDHGGSGVQHVAVHVHDIVQVVTMLRLRGVQFATIPSPYYDQLEARLERIGVGRIAEPLETLRKLGILVDGSRRGQYLLQIFVQDDAGFLGGTDRSPFFLELIERRGCGEFGAGNFRALFDSIAAAQASRVDASQRG